MSSHFIKFTEQNNTGIIKLNRPDALNALNSEMAIDFLEVLSKWKISHYIKLKSNQGNQKSIYVGIKYLNVFILINLYCILIVLVFIWIKKCYLLILYPYR